MTLHRRLFLAGLGTMTVAGPAMIRLAHGETNHRLTVLHMNDLHSRHEPVDARFLTCSAVAQPAKPDCFGGSARLVAALLAERAAAEAAGRTVLLVDAGDQFQGSLFYTAWHGEVELAVMHVLGTEAMAVGNHEFDNGPQTLARFIKGARFPILSANIDAASEPALAGLIRPSVLLHKGGLHIGVVGLTTQQTMIGSSPGPNVHFNDPGPALAAQAALLRAQGATLVIALSHLGWDDDRALAGNIPGVDVFVGGHSHTLLSDSEKGAEGPAHEVRAGTAGRAVVVQAACYGRYFGRLDLDIDSGGTVLAYGGDTRRVTLDMPEHPEVARIIASYAVQLDGVRQRVVGHAPAALDNATCRVAECALGSFTADAMLASVHGAEIAITNGGGLRVGLPEGDITVGDVMAMLPFGNTVATMQLKGADVAAALANGFSRAGAGAFPQIAGLRATWKPLAEPSARLGSIAVRQPDGGYAMLDPERVYRVVTNNFMRGGGDGYTMFKQNAIDPYDAGPPLDEMIAAAIAAASPFSPLTDGRIGIE